MSQRPARRRVGWIVGLSALGKLLLGGAAIAAARPTARETLAFCEQLEPVVEAVTDRKPARVQIAAHRAQKWWRVNGADPSYRTALAQLVRHADARRAPQAAVAALRISEEALDQCGEREDVSLALTRLDLAGMSAWLRSTGIEAASPGGAIEAARFVAGRLRAGGHTRIANELEAETAAAIAIPTRINGETVAADRLLQRVDQVEIVVRRAW